MKQEEKELLLKDLCARLPYGVVLQLTLWEEKTTDCRLTGIDEDGNLTADVPADCAFSIEGIKPHLRPMSSMTEEESAELSNIISKWFDKEVFYLTEEPFLEYALSRINYSISPLLFDYLNSIHVDYRGLIPMGLALEAPDGMYK